MKKCDSRHADLKPLRRAYAEGFKLCKAYLKGTTMRLLP